MDRKKMLKDLDEIVPVDGDEMDRFVFGEGKRKNISGKHPSSISRK